MSISRARSSGIFPSSFSFQSELEAFSTGSLVAAFRSFRVSKVSRFQVQKLECQISYVETSETLKACFLKTQNPPTSASGGGCELRNYYCCLARLQPVPRRDTTGTTTAHGHLLDVGIEHCLNSIPCFAGGAQLK